jgi:hypothetical protein
MARWFPTDSFLHTPKFKTSIKEDKACFSTVSAKLSRLHLTGSGTAHPWPNQVAIIAVLRPGWRPMPTESKKMSETCATWGLKEEERCPGRKLRSGEGTWVSSMVVCCPHMTVKLSQTCVPVPLCLLNPTRLLEYGTRHQQVYVERVSAIAI